jgi:MFS family permease
METRKEAAVEPRSSAYGGNVWRLLLFTSLMNFLVWLPIWVVFFQGKGLSLSQIGLFEACAWLIAAAVEVPTGAIADRWGRKVSMAIGAGLYALAMFLVLADVLSPFFLIGYALWNTSSAFIGGADAAFLYDSLKADGRTSEAAKRSGRSLGVQQAAQGVGAVLGAWIATIDITMCFTIAGLCGLAAAAIALSFKEPPRLLQGETQLGYRQNIVAALKIASDRPVVRWLVVLGALLPLIPLTTYYVLLQPYAIGVGVPVVWLGAIVLAVQLATFVASSLTHRTQGRVSLPTLVAAGIVVVIAAGALLGSFPSIPALGLVALVALVPAVLQPLLSSRLNDLIPSTQRATILSLNGLVSELGLVATMPTMLWLADSVGAPSAAALSAVLFGSIVIPLFLLWRSAEHDALSVNEPACAIATAAA